MGGLGSEPMEALATGAISVLLSTRVGPEELDTNPHSAYRLQSHLRRLAALLFDSVFARSRHTTESVSEEILLYRHNTIHE